MFNDRWWENHMFTYGSVGDGMIWKQVHSEYKADRLDVAWEVAQSLGIHSSGQGVGFLRMLEAELETRKRSFWEDQNGWLSLEMSQGFAQERWDALRDVAERAIQETALALGFAEQPKVLMTVILDELDTPWTPGRFGYHTKKEKYHKICLPENLLDRPNELYHAIKHEYCHVVSSQLTEESCPTWLDEAIAMAISDSLIRDYAAQAQQDEELWLGPDDLDVAFMGAIGDPDQSRAVHRAYAQSSWIGKYLMSLGGGQRLGKLLAAFGDNSLWGEFKLRVMGTRPAEEALRQVYKLGIQEVFDNAKASLGIQQKL
ncbi:MAG: hypothetical protein KF784_07780 [Fimbriimonadaceae bacterium]|nr:hypothetical protein [Fimbriimonadaceae bacterium]